MLRGDNQLLVLLVGLALIRGIIYMAVFPPWLAPDEATHFEAIRIIGQKGVWPTEAMYRTQPMHPELHASFQKFRVWQISRFDVPAGHFSSNPATDPYFFYYPDHVGGGGVITAGQYPLVYHTLLSFLSAWLKPLEVTQQLYLLRLTSLLLTVLTVITGWFFGRVIFPDQKAVAVATSSFLVFWPMFLHINTAVTSDVLATLLGSLYFLVLAKLFCGPGSRGWFLLSGVLLAAAILTKASTLFLIPTSATAVLVYLGHRFRWPGRLMAGFLLALLPLVLAGAVILFSVSNGGRGVSTFSLSFASLPLSTTGYFSRNTVTHLLQMGHWSFLSWWGLFGWASIPVPFGWIRVFFALSLVIGLGLALFIARQVFNGRGGSRLRSGQKNLLVTLLLSLVFAGIGLYTPTLVLQSQTWAAQSRYLFPALLPMALFFFLGFQQLFPHSRKHLVLPVWLAGLISFDSLVLFYVLIPSIYVV